METPTALPTDGAAATPITPTQPAAPAPVAAAPPAQTPATPLQQMKLLHGQGLYLQAYEISKQFGPFQSWTDPEMLVIGGRLAHNLGADRLGRIMHRAAHRAAPDNTEATYFYAMSMSSRWGLLETWNQVQKLNVDHGSSKIQADWLAFKALTVAGLRDFEAAEEALDQALALHADRSWLHVCRTHLLERQDRPEEALESAVHALQLRPWYRPAVQNLAYRLVQLNRDDDALELLGEAVNRLESGDLRVHLAALLLELRKYEAAREIYESLDRYFPLAHLERKRPEWLAARRADAAYHCEQFAAAIEHAQKADSPFYTGLAERLQNDAGVAKRVVLPVKYVRQNHVTCAPATLSAISDYWKKPAPHLELAEEICLDGTPAHSERRWANSNGFVTREFRVTFDVAKQLIDRGVPFTLTTVDPGSAHLQAVIGYDEYRQSLLIRDPSERHHDEFPCKEMLEHYAPCGPRGMAMAPVEQAELLEGIEFPEADLYDLLFEAEVALEAHNRDEAASLVAKMCAIDESHRLTLRARGNMAHYDGNTTELLNVLDGLLEKFPDDVNSKMSKLACLQQLGRREERVAMLRDAISRADCDPIFWSRYAAELVDDARERDLATYYLERCARFRPHDVAAYDLLASLAMDQQKYDEAITLYRFSACIADMNERQTQSYFYAARSQNQANSALRFILDRVERFGKKTSLPTQTLCWALDQLERTSDALKVLEKAVRRHPDDGELMLYTASFMGRYGKLGQAWALLEKAQGKCHEMAWLRTAASLAHCEGDLAEALAHWKKVIESEPLDTTAHRFVVELIADTDSEQAAIHHLKRYVERFPHSYDLNMQLIESLDDPDEKRQQLERFLELNPSDAWALRELAFLLIGQHKYEHVEEIVDRAEQIEPNHPAVGFVRGRVERSRKNMAQARERFQESIRVCVDYDYSILGLLDCCENKAERVAALEFLHRELQTQVIFGDGLLAFQEHAAQTFEPAELLERLQQTRRKRSDLWHAWSAEIRQLSNMQRHEEAVKLAVEACDRFRLLPRIWIDRAMAHAACGDIDGEIESLRQAKAINPSWGEPARLLSEAYEKKGDLESARAEIERVIQSEPRDVRNHGFLAALMWQQDQQQEAVDTIVGALEMQPGYTWGWSVLRDWALQLDQYDKVVQITQKMTEQRPNDYRAWLLYAESLGEREDIEGAVRALDRAIEINPNCSDAYNQKAFQLARAGQFDEAIDATQPFTFMGKIPLELQARAAWIEGERGNVETAVAQMEAVVAQDQDYAWAWHRLAEWYEFLNQDDKYYEAAQQMVRLEPQNPVSWGYLGDGELRRDNLAAAKEHFRQAVQIAPDYSFASSRLVDLQIEDREFDAALETIQTISPHIPPAWVMSEQVRIESLRGDQAQTFALLRELAVIPADDPSAIDSAVEAIYHAGWGEDSMPLLDQLLDIEGAQPGVAYVFVNMSSTLKRWDECDARLGQLTDRPELLKEGVRKLVEELASEEEIPRFHQYVETQFHYLRSDNDLWDAVGDAYNCIGQHEMALKWMAGWESRQGVTANHAHTVAYAFWRLKRPHDAAQPARFAMEHLPPDFSCGSHISLLAYYELVWGSPQACCELISMLDPNSLGPQYHLLFQYVVATLESLSTQQPYRVLARQLRETYRSLPDEVQKDPYFKWQYDQIAIRAAELYGKSFTAMWLRFWL